MDSQILWSPPERKYCDHSDLPEEAKQGTLAWCASCELVVVHKHGEFSSWWGVAWFPRRWWAKLLGRI